MECIYTFERFPWVAWATKYVSNQLKLANVEREKEYVDMNNGRYETVFLYNLNVVDVKLR